MDEAMTNLPVRQITPAGARDTTDLVVRETAVAIVLNGRPLATLPASPLELEALAAGYLAGRGLVGRRADIISLEASPAGDAVEIVTTGPSSGEGPLPPPLVDTGCRLTAARISSLARQFQRRARLFRATGGVHGAALAGEAGIIHFSEDVSRHSAIDKIIGHCILHDIPSARCLLLTGGRVAADIVARVARAGLPVLVSRAAPTDRAVALAGRLGVTLVGFARGQRMNVYTGAERIIANNCCPGLE